MKSNMRSRATIGLILAILAGPACTASMLDRRAMPIEVLQPDYPAMLSKEKKKGIVYIQVEVDTKGNPTLKKVFGASSPEFIEAVAAAVAKWKFRPARRGDQSVIDIREFAVLFDPIEGIAVRGPVYEP